MSVTYKCDRCGQACLKGAGLARDVEVGDWKAVPGGDGRSPIKADVKFTMRVSISIHGLERELGDDTVPDLCPDCLADITEELLSRLRTR